MSRRMHSAKAARAIVTTLLVLLAHSAFVWAGPSRPKKLFADFDPSRVPPPAGDLGRPVARVFDRYIPGDSLAAPGAGVEDRADALVAAAWRMLAERYVAEAGIAATAAEVDEVLRVFRERGSLTGEDSVESRRIAAHLVTQWKLNRSLYARYGGRVIFQQLDPLEPVGAYHDFLVEMEKRKILVIYDRELRPGFWRYFKAEHPFEIPPDQVNFDTPWWLRLPPVSSQSVPEPSREPAPRPAGARAEVPAEGYVVLGEKVRFVFDPAQCESATSGTTGQWTALKSLRIASVHLAGDFNGWSTSAWLMRPVGSAEDLYVLERGFEDLGGPGSHQFKFVVNSEWWVEPPARAPNRKETNLGNQSVNFELVVPSAPVAASGAVQTWTNIDPETRSITRVDIVPGAGVWRIHAWGRCHPTDCDWGENVATAVAGAENRYTVTWKQSHAIRAMTLELRTGGVLVVHTQTHFTDSSGRADHVSTDTFRRR